MEASPKATMPIFTACQISKTPPPPTKSGSLSTEFSCRHYNEHRGGVHRGALIVRVLVALGQPLVFATAGVRVTRSRALAVPGRGPDQGDTGRVRLGPHPGRTASGAPGAAASFTFCRWRAALRRRFFSRRAAVRRVFSSAEGGGGGGGAAAGGGAGRGGSGGGGGSATKRPLSSVWPVALFQSFELAFFSLRSIDDFFCAPPLFSGCIGRRIDGHGAASTRPAALRRQRRRFVATAK